MTHLHTRIYLIVYLIYTISQASYDLMIWALAEFLVPANVETYWAATYNALWAGACLANLMLLGWIIIALSGSQPQAPQICSWGLALSVVNVLACFFFVIWAILQRAIGSPMAPDLFDTLFRQYRAGVAGALIYGSLGYACFVHRWR